MVARNERTCQKIIQGKRKRKQCIRQAMMTPKQKQKSTHGPRDLGQWLPGGKKSSKTKSDASSDDDSKTEISTRTLAPGAMVARGTKNSSNSAATSKDNDSNGGIRLEEEGAGAKDGVDLSPKEDAVSHKIHPTVKKPLYYCPQLKLTRNAVICFSCYCAAICEDNDTGKMRRSKHSINK